MSFWEGIFVFFNIGLLYGLVFALYKTKEDRK